MSGPSSAETEYVDPVTFARTVLGIELLPWQAEVARSVALGTRAVVRVGARSGRSTLNRVLEKWRDAMFGPTVDEKVIIRGGTSVPFTRTDCVGGVIQNGSYFKPPVIPR